MPEPAKKPARAKSKPPTRAAALKALGLTAAEFKELQDLKKFEDQQEGRFERELILDQAAKSGPIGESFQGGDSDPDELFAEDTGGNVDPDLIHEMISVEVTDENAIYPTQLSLKELAELEAFKTSLRGSKASDPRVGIKYIRNLYESPIRIKIDKDTSHNLKPRGWRGDFSALAPGHEFHANVLQNVEAGLVEVLTHEEAQATITKQHKNATSHDHLRSFILNPYTNENYEQEQFKVATNEETQGFTVASLNSQGGIGREETPGSGKVAQGIQDVRNPPAPQGLSGRALEMARDAQARDAKGDASSVLDGLNVSIDPVQAG